MFRIMLGILARDAFRAASKVARTLLPGVAAVAIAIGVLASASYETRYTDASGARCLSFRITNNREADICSGMYDRPSPMPPAFPFDWQPDASTGGAK